MNPFERKIVHDAVVAAGLTSESEGEEPSATRGHPSCLIRARDAPARAAAEQVVLDGLHGHQAASISRYVDILASKESRWPSWSGM